MLLWKQWQISMGKNQVDGEHIDKIRTGGKNSQKKTRIGTRLIPSMPATKWNVYICNIISRKFDTDIMRTINYRIKGTTGDNKNISKHNHCMEIKNFTMAR